MKTIAIIGSTASGKTSLSIDIAQKTNSIILSLDSLSVYKEINIASAKPTEKEKKRIIHFGINELYPDEKFDVMCFIKCYEKAKEYALKHNKNLIIVGGTGFYLKTLIEGISSGFSTDEPLIKTPQETYDFLYNLDKDYMSKIKRNDSYRIKKAYTIYKKSGEIPSIYFKNNPKTPFVKNLKIFEILWEREILKERIKLRTNLMLKEGIIDEVIQLENKYTRYPNPMSSIGILETLEFLDGKLNKQELEEKISLNTAKLAKRQNTFNKSQFKNKTSDTLLKLNLEIFKYFSI